MTLRRLLPALLLPVLLVPLVSCGGGGGEPEATAASRAEFSATDVEFATGMIQHHAQALAMVDLTLGRGLDPELVALTEQIRAAQTPEVETMTDWLTSWEKPIPETVRDHANAHGEGHLSDSDMPGMLSSEDFDELEALAGAEFEEEWLTLMVQHHQGAIEMAEQEIQGGTFSPAIALAEEIVRGQNAEIEQMEKLLAAR